MDEKKAPHISIVIPARNEGAWLERTTRNIQRSFAGEDRPRIHIVDDGSTDKCASTPYLWEMAAEITRHSEPKGIAASRTEGADAEIKHSDVVVVIDAHMEFDSGAIRRLANTAHDKQAITCGVVQGMTKAKPKAGGQFLFMRDWYLGYRYVPDAALPEGTPDVIPLEFLTGAFYAFPRKLWQKLDGLGWQNTVDVWGHSGASMSLAAFHLGIPMLCDRRAHARHRYGNVEYGISALSQWRNACRVYAVMFDKQTFAAFWARIFSRALEHDEMRSIVDGASKIADKFSERKTRSDADFFRERLGVPFEERDGVVISVPRVSVVIPTCNDGEWLAKTVTSIKESARFDAEIIVVSDRSTDESIAAVDKLGKKLDKLNRKKAIVWPRVKVLLARERMGVAAARNWGAAEADGDVLLFADGHTLWDKGTLASLANNALRIERGIVCSSFANFREDPDAPAATVYGAKLQVRETRGLGAHYIKAKPDEPLSLVPAIIGSTYAMTREFFEWLKGFQEVPGGLWGYAEVDLDLKRFFWGFEMYVDREAFIRHRLREPGQYPITDESVWLRANFIHCMAFGRGKYESDWRPILKKLGWSPAVDNMLETCSELAEARATFEARMVRTNAQFAQWLCAGQPLPLAAPPATALPQSEPAVPVLQPKFPRRAESIPPRLETRFRVAACCAEANTKDHTLIYYIPRQTWIFLLAASAGDQTHVNSTMPVKACPFCGMLLDEGVDVKCTDSTLVHWFVDHVVMLVQKYEGKKLARI